MTETAASRVTWRGVKLDARTRDALKWAERKSGVKVTPSQGSFSSSVAASGSTHSGSSAVDLSVRGLSRDDRVRLVHALKDAGFAAWYRKPSEQWGPHIHAIAIGGGKDGTEVIGGNRMAASAGRQVRAFDAGRDGLTGNRPDDTYRPSRRRFSYKQGKPVKR